MNYLELNFTVNPTEPGNDVLIAMLGELPFDTFEETENGFKAYIPKDSFNEEDIKSISFDGINYTYLITEIEQQNWNAQWEQQFEPVIVNDKCAVYASFHNLKGKYEFGIEITPKMSFGTGHHQTTMQMMQGMMDHDFKNKKVLDMGCGTAVLAILAVKLGAAETHAVDIDDWSIENSIENCATNNCEQIKIYKGDIDVVLDSFDIILANINRNILGRHIPSYAKLLTPNGKLFLSGFYEHDIPYLESIANEHKLTLQKAVNKEGWACIQLIKN